jgi:hypothetical protein
MRNHTVEISDAEGNAFTIKLSTPNAAESIKSNVGTWRSIEKGYIRIGSGKATRWRSNASSTNSDILLNYADSKGQGWGIQLRSYEDFWGVNDQGTGYVNQTWCLKIVPTEISWVVLD